jgi:hypothetical protein
VIGFQHANSASIRVELKFKAAILTTTPPTLTAKVFAAHIAIVIFLYLPTVIVLVIMEAP